MIRSEGESMKEIQDFLFENQDIKYKEFNSKLIPNLNPEKMIGVRISVLRKFSKTVYRDLNYREFLNDLPHKFFEEDNLHAFVLSQFKEFDELILEVERFLPYIDNWATCDSFSPPIFKKNAVKLIPFIEKWINSEHTYTCRYAIGMLMENCLGENFDVKHLEIVSNIKRDDYYVNMMIAWYFCEALLKRFEKAVKYIEGRQLEKWCHNKAIQKYLESNRAGKEEKEYLRSLKY